MTSVRINTGINKAADVDSAHWRIRLAQALQRVFPTALASHLQFLGWIC